MSSWPVLSWLSPEDQAKVDAVMDAWEASLPAQAKVRLAKYRRLKGLDPAAGESE